MSDDKEKLEETAQEQATQKPRKKRLLKKIVLIFGVCLLVILALLLCHPLWIGAAGRSVATSLTPSYTGTDFKLANLSLNAYSGKLTVNTLGLNNPEGGPQELPEAVSVGSLFVDVAPLSLASSDIHVREIRIESPHVSTFCISNQNNFAIIGENVEKKVGPKKEKKDEKPSDTKVGIDHLLITDLRVDFGTASALTIPKIELSTVTNVATLIVENFRISNPKEETSVTNAASFGKLTVTLDWDSLFTKKIHIYDITLDEPYVSAFFFDKIPTSLNSFNLMRAFAEVIPAESSKEKSGEDKTTKEKKSSAEEEECKIIIDRISLVRTNCRILGIDFGGVIKERIEICDIGKSANGQETGTSAENVVQEEIWPRLKKEMGSKFETAVDSFAKLYEMASGGVGLDLSKVKDDLSNMKNAAKQVLDTQAVKAVDAVGGAAKEGAKKAVDAVGGAAKEGATKALDAVKGLNPFGGK